MTLTRPQLADALLTASHVAERNLIAAFIANAVTQPAPNPLPNTSVGAVRQIWRQRATEFQSFDVHVAGLSCLLATLSDMSVSEVLVQEILRAGLHTVNVFHQAAPCQIVGAVLSMASPGMPYRLHRLCRSRIVLPSDASAPSQGSSICSCER